MHDLIELLPAFKALAGFTAVALAVIGVGAYMVREWPEADRKPD